MNKFSLAITNFVAFSIVWVARFITAVRGTWIGIEPSRRRRVYFANHASNGDFILLWAVLPPYLRYRTRPVAGLDYWLTSKIKTYLGAKVFKSVLIDRNRDTRTEDPVEVMAKALNEGSSLILFPEGTRNMTDAKMLPFKPGLFHLAKTCPDVEMVPVWIENLNRVLPKGEIIPIPFACHVTFGPPILLKKGEGKQAFLTRAEQSMRQIIPGNGDENG